MPAGSRPLISFDLDGVLVRPPFGWNPAMRRYAQISPDYVGTRTSAPHASTRWDRVLGATYYRARYARRRLMPGAREALEAAAGRYRVVVLSARSARGRAQTEAWLRRQGFLSYVEGVVLNDTRMLASHHKLGAVRRLGIVRHIDDDVTTAVLLARAGVAVDLVDWPRNRGLSMPPGVTRRADLHALCAALRSTDTDAPQPRSEDVHGDA